MATKESGTRRTSSRPKKRPTCTQPKQPQPLWHLVEALHGAEALSQEVEEVVGVKEDPASKAFKMTTIIEGNAVSTTKQRPGAILQDIVDH